MELKIEPVSVPASIAFNFDELKAEVTAKAAEYKAMVYSADEIKNAKADRASLNRFVKAMETERKRVKRLYMQPYSAFESQVKEINGIVLEAVHEIDSQLERYEVARQLEKHDKITKYFDSLHPPAWLKLEHIFQPQWLNATYAFEKIKADIESKLQQVVAETEVICEVPYAFEAMETYKSTLSLPAAMAESKRLAEMQRRKNVAQQAERAKNADFSPERVWMGFKAFLTVDDARELNAFFKARNIEFKAMEV